MDIRLAQDRPKNGTGFDELTSYWRWIGNGLVLGWPRIRTQLDGLTSDRPFIGRGSTSDWHWIGTGLVWIDSDFLNSNAAMKSILN